MQRFSDPDWFKAREYTCRFVPNPANRQSARILILRDMFFTQGSSKIIILQYFYTVRKRKGCCRLSVQSVLLLAALISVVTAGQREEIELEIVETLLSSGICVLLPHPVFSDVSTKANGKSRYCQHCSDTDFSQNTVLKCQRLHSPLWVSTTLVCICESSFPLPLSSPSSAELTPCALLGREHWVNFGRIACWDTLPLGRY